MLLYFRLKTYKYLYILATWSRTIARVGRPLGVQQPLSDSQQCQVHPNNVDLLV